MASFNQVAIAGNLTRDPEVKYTQGGTAVCTLGLAVNEKRKQGEQWVEDVLFVDVTCWGRTAEVAGEYLKKGAPVLIGGRLKYDSWEKDGKKNSKLSVVCDKLQMLGGNRGGGEAKTEDEYPQAPVKTAGPPAADEIPFAFIGFLLTAALGSGLFT